MRNIDNYLAEDGNRWLDAQEQLYNFVGIAELRPYVPRPLWLVLSIALRETGFAFENGIGVEGQMDNMRKAWKWWHERRTPKC